MNITKIFISIMLLVAGMFSSTVNAAAGEAVFDSFEDCDEARVAYTPVGRNRMTTGQAMILADVHPKFREGFNAGTWNGTCVRSSQVVRRVDGQATVVAGWVFLLGDFPVVKVGGKYFMQACSNPIEQIGAPRRVAAQPSTQIYTDQAQRQRVPESMIPPVQPPQVQVVYVDRPQQQMVYTEQRRERFCDRHTRGCDFVQGVAQDLTARVICNQWRACSTSRYPQRVVIDDRRGYPNNGQWPPRRRPSEPIYGDNNGGTQWRETRQWDNNGLSRGNAREPVYDNSGQWGPAYNQWR